MAGLERAVRENRFRQVDMTIRLGSDVNSKVDGGKTLLMVCCKMSNPKASLKMAKLLHEKGARLDLVDKKGHDVLVYAVINNKPLILNYLIQNMHEFNVNAGDQDGNTALHFAVGLGLFKITQILVKALRTYDLSLSKRNFFGYTPLMVAMQRKHSAIEMYLRNVMQSKKVPLEYPGYFSSDSRSCAWLTGSHQARTKIVSDQFVYRTDTPKLERSRTMPTIRQKALDRRPSTDSDISTIRRMCVDKSSRNSSRSSSAGPQNCKDTLQGLFDLWQRQLSYSYRPTAEAIYDDYGSDSLYPELLSVCQDSDTSRASSRSGVSLRSGFKSVSPFPQTRTSVSPLPLSRSANRSAESNLFGKPLNGGKVDTLLPPTPSAGISRLDSGNHTLRVPSARRSGTVSPRPVIKVVNVI